MAKLLGGIDWGTKSGDMTAIAMKCSCCSRVIHAEVTNGDEISMPVFSKCPVCGQKIQTVYLVPSFGEEMVHEEKKEED